MPSAAPLQPQTNSPPPPDDLDNLFNYDDAVNDFLTDIPLSKPPANPHPTSPKKDVDEEVIVRKKRAPIPKLDAHLLQTPRGLPKLRKIAKTRLKFRGKGHEFADMAMLLSAYQLWLDDLYPRAKFRDALEMVEKAGHGKMMGVMRRAWLDETKPSATEVGGERDGERADVVMSGALPMEEFGGDDVAGEVSNGNTGGNDSRREDDAPDDDELDVLLGEQHLASQATNPRPTGNEAPFDLDESDDDLDALAAENAQVSRSVQPRTAKRKALFDEDDDEDDLDALLAKQDQAPKSAPAEPTKRKGPFDEDEDNQDEDELDTLLAEEAAPSKPTGTTPQNNPKNQHTSTNETENDFADDEAAMAEMDMW